MADRKAIRDDAIALLTAAGVAGGNVILGALGGTITTPAAGVHVGPQRFVRRGGGEPSYRVEADIIVVLRGTNLVTTGATAYDEMDGLVDAVLTALFNDAAWVAQWEAIPAVTNTVVLNEGTSSIWIMTMTITVQYALTFEPTVADSLITVHADFDMASPRNDPQSPTGPDAQIDAADDVTLPQ